MIAAIDPILGQKSALNGKILKVPIIQNVGVIPLQVLGISDNQNSYIDRLSVAFPESVKDARRFKVLNDDLVSSMWDTKDGRSELIKEFELHAFVALVLQEKDDMVAFTAQLLNSNLQPYLIESETINKYEVSHFNADQIRNFLQDIIFRMTNRIPVDVTVTSIQGPFLTLSGGTEQNIAVSDQLQVIRSQILSTHPANKTWLEFKKSTLGTAQVIEVKNHTSIAKITSQTYDAAIEVGDGAKIVNIANRRKFALAQSSQTFNDAGNQNAVMVAPVLVEGGNGQPPNVNKEHKLAEKSEILPSNNAPTTENNQSPSSPQTSSSSPIPQAVNEDQEEQSVWENLSSDATSHKLLDAITIFLGPYWWSVQGPTNSSGRFPIYLVNHLGAEINRTMLYKFKLSLGGGGVFGATPAGGYLGYDAFARFFWEDHLSGDFFSWWRAGGASSFSGLNVSKGPYGGGDWIRGGFFGGLGGFFSLEEPNSRIDWFGDFTITPLNIGRMGYDGGFKQVESAMGWRLGLGGYLWAPADEIQYGGMFQLGDERQTLKNGRRPHFKDFAIKALVKFSL